MSEQKKQFRIWILALALCACAVWIGSYVSYRRDQAAEQTVVAETYTDVMLGSEPAPDVPAIATEPAAQTGNPVLSSPDPTAAATAPTERKPLKTMSPVSGDGIYGYSMEALSYNQTTRDWRVHDGLDLAAETGAPVAAAADGEVYAVFEDDAMGHTVVIRHADGYTTRYASLADTPAVKAGDTVTLGQTIGYAGESAIVECGIGSHVHFSVSCYDKTVDPQEFLALGK